MLDKHGTQFQLGGSPKLAKTILHNAYHMLNMKNYELSMFVCFVEKPNFCPAV
jgi:hypothetical protein